MKHRRRNRPLELAAKAIAIPFALAIQAVLPHPALDAKERNADVYESVGDSEQIVIGVVKEVRADGAVVLRVEKWLKGKPAVPPEVTLRGRTGHCVINGPVGMFMKEGERYLAFIFAGGRPGRFGTFQRINPDGRLPGARPSYLSCGRHPPKTEAELVRLIEHIQSPEFVAEQVALLKDADRTVRRDAVVRMGNARAPEAFGPVLKLVQDPEADRAVRAQAILALGRFRNPKAIDPLAAVLREELTGQAPEAAAALGELGDRAAIPLLLRAFDRAMSGEAYDPLSTECVRALGRIGVYSDEVRAAFARALRSAGEYPSGAVIDLAWKQKLRWLTPVLAEAMKSGTGVVPSNAGYALAAMAGASTLPAGRGTARLSEERALALAGAALVDMRLSAGGRSASVRDVNGIGWLVVHGRGEGRLYLYVGDREGKAVLLFPRR